jgi:hypothetical protein
MNYLIKSIFLIAVFAAPISAAAAKPLSSPVQSPCIMTFLKAVQVAPGTAQVDWNSTVDGPYHIDVVDLGTNQVVYKNDTFDNFDTVAGLTANTLYQVIVTDIDNSTLTVNIFIQ